MKIYSINYHFREPLSSNNYIEFFTVLETLGPWCHYLERTWLAATDLSARQIYDRLERFIDDDVHGLIAEMGSDVYGVRPRRAWDWIKEQRGERTNQMVKGLAS